MNRVATESRIVLLDLELFGFGLFIAGGSIARGRLAFLSRLGAFDSDDFSWHTVSVIPFP